MGGHATEAVRYPKAAGGLRERKKIKAISIIQEQALRLFAEQGYQETTVEQIAAAAEISPSTFFRYFPTKKAVALPDSLDPVMIEVFRNQPVDLNVVQALRQTLRMVSTTMSEDQMARELKRGELILKEPELQTAVIDESARNIDMFSALIAERLKRPEDDVGVRALAGAIIGVIMSALLQTAKTFGKDYFDSFDKALEQLDIGLPL